MTPEEFHQSQIAEHNRWPKPEKPEFCCGVDAKQQEEIKELKAMLLFLVNNDSINDSSIEKEVVALLKL